MRRLEPVPQRRHRARLAQQPSHDVPDRPSRHREIIHHHRRRAFVPHRVARRAVDVANDLKPHPRAELDELRARDARARRVDERRERARDFGNLLLELALVRVGVERARAVIARTRGRHRGGGQWRETKRRVGIDRRATAALCRARTARAIRRPNGPRSDERSGRRARWSRVDGGRTSARRTTRDC